MKRQHLVTHLQRHLVTALVLAGCAPVLGAEGPPSPSTPASFALQWALLQGVQAGDEGGEGQADAAASADVSFFAALASPAKAPRSSDFGGMR